MFHSTVFVAVTGISVRSSPPSIMNPLCAKSSPGSSSYNSHIFLKFSKSGKQTLFSHFEMDCREMSSFSETSSCDMFFFFGSLLIYRRFSQLSSLYLAFFFTTFLTKKQIFSAGRC